MYIFRRLYFLIFNPSPAKGSLSSLDKKERKIWYLFNGDGIFYLTAFHRGRNLGHCIFTIKDNVLTLGDIFISERYPKYRNSGIGTKMFQLLIDYGRKNNISRIEGDIQPEQSSLWPKLFKFYHSLGCTIDGRDFTYYL